MKLTDRACANAKPNETAYKLSDGQGMYLEIRPNGSKYWRMSKPLRAKEILGLSKMDWNNFDLYTKLPSTLQSSNEIARIGSLLQRFGTESYDYRLFI